MTKYIVSRYENGRLKEYVTVPMAKGREKLEAWRRIYGAWNVKGFIEDDVPIPGEIFPCPLCGEEPKFVEENFMPFYQKTTIKMTCPACGLTLGGGANVFNDPDRANRERETLISLWNRRDGKVLPAVVEKIIHVDRDW